MMKTTWVLLLVSAACCAALCSCQSVTVATAVGDGPLAVSASGLRAELRNASVRRDNSIELDFVLANGTNTSIRLAQRWNSWGAHQWSFHIVDADGTAYFLSNPQRGWWRNAFTTFTIPPGKEHVMRCRLDMNTRASSNGSVYVFTTGGAMPSPARPNSWKFPVSVRGTFSAKMYEKTERHPGTTWGGSIVSRSITVDRTPNKPSGGDAK